MAKYTLVVLSNANAGKDAEYNEWYNKVHIPDVLNVPGFAAAQRFELADAQLGKSERPHRYLALYELETDDIQGSLKELQKRAGTAAMVISDAINIKGVSTGLFSPIAPRVTASEVRRS